MFLSQKKKNLKENETKKTLKCILKYILAMHYFYQTPSHTLYGFQLIAQLPAYHKFY